MKGTDEGERRLFLESCAEEIDEAGVTLVRMHGLTYVMSSGIKPM